MPSENDIKQKIMKNEKMVAILTTVNVKGRWSLGTRLNGALLNVVSLDSLPHWPPSSMSLFRSTKPIYLL